jgi:hypothetical protein
MTLKKEMCELSSRARAFSVEALIGVKRQRNEETGKIHNFYLQNISLTYNKSPRLFETSTGGLLNGVSIN